MPASNRCPKVRNVWLIPLHRVLVLTEGPWIVYNSSEIGEPVDGICKQKTQQVNTE